MQAIILRGLLATPHTFCDDNNNDFFPYKNEDDLSVWQQCNCAYGFAHTDHYNVTINAHGGCDIDGIHNPTNILIPKCRRQSFDYENVDLAHKYPVQFNVSQSARTIENTSVVFLVYANYLDRMRYECNSMNNIALTTPQLRNL